MNGSTLRPNAVTMNGTRCVNRKDARHQPVERDTKTQYGLPRLMTRILDGTQVRGPLSSRLG